MRLPPWAIEALRQGAADVARKASDDATLAKLREQATELFRDLPDSASRGLDAVLKTAGGAAKEVVDQGRDAFRGWSTPSAPITVPCLNATGTLLHPKGTGIGIAEPVLEAGIGLLRGDYATRTRPTINRALNEVLQRGGEGIEVTSNLHGALRAIAPLAGQNPIALHRSHAIRLPSGLPLPDAFAPAAIRECGGVQSIEPSDFDAVKSGVIVLADDGTHEVTPFDFGDRDVTTVAILPVGTVHDRLEGIPSAEVLLRNGIDLVILPAGPITGGTDCGLLVGREPVLETIRQDIGWSSFVASDAVAAITLAALNQEEPSPVEKLLETSEENLRGRAERIATRMGAVETIETTRITDTSARLVDSTRWNYPSRQLRLRHRSHSADKWAKKLAEQETALFAAAEGDELVVDLRWLAPSADAEVGDALTDV